MPTNIVFIAGMHRSGTSAITGELASHGVNLLLPPDLLDPAIDNPKGFNESLLVNQINNQILEFFGSHWRDPHSLPESWSWSPGIIPARQRISDYLEEYVDAGSDETVLLKDPRFCRTLPLWLDICKKLGLKVKLLLVFRNPSSVASSLWRRNSIPTTHTFQLWVRHYIDIQVCTNFVETKVVEFENFQRSPESITRSLIQWLGSTYKTSTDDFYEAELVSRPTSSTMSREEEALQTAYIQKPEGDVFDRTQLCTAFESLGGNFISMERRHYGVVAMILDAMVAEKSAASAANEAESTEKSIRLDKLD